MTINSADELVLIYVRSELKRHDRTDNVIVFPCPHPVIQPRVIQFNISAHVLFPLRQKMSRMDQCRPLLLSHGLQFHSPSRQLPPGACVVHRVGHW